MEATLTKEIITKTPTSKAKVIEQKKYSQNDSKEFLLGVLYIIKKVFLIG